VRDSEAEAERSSAPARGATSPLKRWGRHAIGWIITAVCLAVIARNVNVGELTAALADFHWPFLALGLVSLAFGYALRIVRWRVMLSAAGGKVTTRECVAPFLGSIGLNNVLPLRAGDVVRAFVFPAALGVPRVLAAGSLLMERLVDLLTLLACLAAGMLLTQTAVLPDWVKDGAAVFTVVGVLALMVIFLGSGWMYRFATQKLGGGTGRVPAKPVALVLEILRTFDAMSRPLVILSLFLLSFLAWMGEAGLFWSLLRGFDLPSTLGTSLIVMSIVTLSTLAPSSPGYVGPFHLAAFAAVSMLDGTNGQATSFAVVSHLALWLPTTLTGGMAMLVRPDLFRGLYSGRSSSVQKES
jgi:uncharacterized protein (TIRG00374 family)